MLYLLLRILLNNENYVEDNNELIKIGLRTIISIDQTLKLLEKHQVKRISKLISNFETDIVLIDFTALGFEIQTIKELNPSTKTLKLWQLRLLKILKPLQLTKNWNKSYVKDCDLTEVDALKETYGESIFLRRNTKDHSKSKYRY